MTDRVLAIATACLTFFLLLVGGIVHGTGSSLACPDWPTCYGTFFPEMKGGIFFEHSHRLVASLVGLLTIGIVVLVRRRRRGKSLQRLSLAALGLVIFQGILGGITVIYKLPAAVSSAHLAVSMIFFSLLIVLSFLLSEEDQAAPGPGSLPAGIQKKLGVVLLLIYFQIVLGGIVRHLHAGLVCIDIPLCNGELWPSAHPMQRLHMIHRMGGVLVAFAVFWISVQLLKEERAGKWVRLLAGLAPFLVIAQVTLGLLSVTTFLGLVPVTAHLGGGALLLATFVSLWMICRRAGLSPTEISAPSGVQAAGA